MNKILTKIVLGNDIGRMIVEKIIKKVVKEQLGVDLAMTIRDCNINGTEKDTTLVDLSICLEMSNEDLKNVIERYL